MKNLENQQITQDIQEPLILLGIGDLYKLRMTAQNLRTAGYRVITAPSSHRIIQLAESKEPDLIVLDTQISGLDGIETCRMMKEHIGLPMPVIFYSAENAENTILNAYSCGAIDFISQQASVGILRVKIKVILDEYRLNQAQLPETSDENLSLQIPGYRFLGALGKGATGTVYLAQETKTAKKVAIKVLNPRTVHNLRNIQRFYRGSLIGLELPPHPNIVQIHEIKRTSENIYQVMEYVPGRTLDQIIRENNLLSEDEAIRVLSDLATALDHLHQHQVLHRDVKPANIFIMDDWESKLGDLGISRRMIDRMATSTGHVVGTPSYLSPEQIMNRHNLDIRVDLYSLGLTLYHATTGENPYLRDTAYLSMLARIEGPEVRLTPAIAVHISQDLCNIISKLIRRDPEERYASPRDLLDAIRILKG